MSNEITVGAIVVRIGSQKDYATGRVGEVKEIDEKQGRARVYWTTERDGSTVRNSAGGLGVRTWVNFRFLVKRS